MCLQKKEHESDIHSYTELSISYLHGPSAGGLTEFLGTDHDGSKTGSMLSLCVCVCLFQDCQQSPLFVFCFYFLFLLFDAPKRPARDRSGRNESDRLTRSGLDARQD